MNPTKAVSVDCRRTLRPKQTPLDRSLGSDYDFHPVGIYLHQPAARLDVAGIGKEATIVVEDLFLHHLQLGSKNLKAGRCLAWQSRIILIDHDGDQPIRSSASAGCGDPELGHVGAKGIADLSALPGQDHAQAVHYRLRRLI